MIYIPAPASLSRLILAHDCGAADRVGLSEADVAKGKKENAPDVPLFYSAGLGVTLLCFKKALFPSGSSLARNILCLTL